MGGQGDGGAGGEQGSLCSSRSAPAIALLALALCSLPVIALPIIALLSLRRSCYTARLSHRARSHTKPLTTVARYD
jgi:hypothetical protein